LRPALPGSSDILMTIAKALTICVCYIAALVRMVSMKNQFFKINGWELTTKRNLLYVFLSMFLPGMVAYIYPGVTDWLSLLGAVCQTTLGLVFPT